MMVAKSLALLFVAVVGLGAADVDWTAGELVCLHQHHHGQRRSYSAASLSGCQAACQRETSYSCRSVFYSKEGDCYGDSDFKACYDSTRWQSRKCDDLQIKDGYKMFEFSEKKRYYGGCNGTDFECPCMVSRYVRGDFGKDPRYRCQSRGLVCDGETDCWGRNKDDELLDNCPEETKERVEEGTDDCMDASNGGAEYRGRVAESADGQECLPWDEAADGIVEQFLTQGNNIVTYLNYHNFKGDHNYCRNPLLTWHSVSLKPTPYCYVKSVGTPVQSPCKIQTCDNPKSHALTKALTNYYSTSMDNMVENQDGDYKYFMKTEGCQLSFDDWWNNIQRCKRFNPGDQFGLCPYGICEKDSAWYECIRDVCKLDENIKTREAIVDLIEWRYSTCHICSIACAKSTINACIQQSDNTDLAKPNGKWTQCVNHIFEPMSRCGIPKYWTFPNIQD